MAEKELTLDEETPAEEPVDSTPDETLDETPAIETTLEDEIELMSEEEARAFAKRTLKQRRDGNAEAVRLKKELQKDRAELAAIRETQVKAKRAAELAAMEEKDRMAAQLADSQAEAAAEREKRQTVQAENAIMSAATRLNFNDPADAANNIDIRKVLVEGQLDAAAVEEQVAALAQAKEYLLKQAKKTPTILDAPATPRTENPAPNQDIVDRLTTPKAKALGEEQVKFQEAQQVPGREGAYALARSYRKLRELDPKVGTGEYMDEALVAHRRKTRED